jgi:hypothetical protein
MLTLSSPTLNSVLAPTAPPRFGLDQLKAQVQSGAIVGATLSQPVHGMQTLRFFVSLEGDVCFFGKGRRRFGYRVTDEYLAHIAACIPAPAPKDPALVEYHAIAKYRRLALTATFSNPFIQRCRALPASIEQWKDEGQKSLSKYGITTGNEIDGKVITVAALATTFSPSEVEQFRHAIRTTATYSTCRHPFRGYEAHLATWTDGQGGVYAGLSVEFKGCGNGYYYNLVNDDAFIGADVD